MTLNRMSDILNIDTQQNDIQQNYVQPNYILENDI